MVRFDSWQLYTFSEIRGDKRTSGITESRFFKPPKLPRVGFDRFHLIVNYQTWCWVFCDALCGKVSCILKCHITHFNMEVNEDWHAFGATSKWPLEELQFLDLLRWLRLPLEKDRKHDQRRERDQIAGQIKTLDVLRNLCSRPSFLYPPGNFFLLVCHNLFSLPVFPVCLYIVLLSHNEETVL